VQFTFDRNYPASYTAVRIAVPEKNSAIRTDASWDWVHGKWTREETTVPGAPIQVGKLSVRLPQPANLQFTKQKQIKLGISHCPINENAPTSFMTESVSEAFVIVISHLARATKGMRLTICRLLVSHSQMIESTRNLVRHDFEKFEQYCGSF
jgi:hypothetical protein